MAGSTRRSASYTMIAVSNDTAAMSLSDPAGSQAGLSVDTSSRDAWVRAIRAMAKATGLWRADAAAIAARYAGHSLRAGLAKTAAEANVPGHLIQRQMQHKRFDTTTRYIRKGQIFKQNAAAIVGL